MDKQGVLDFLKKNKLCVIATASLEGKPEAAVMACVIKDNFSILMSTESTTRKYGNLKSNDRVALVVGGLNNDPTVQIDGEFIGCNGEEEAKALKQEILTYQPELTEYLDSPNSCFFTVKPIWLRYSDFAETPPEVLEISSF